MDLPIPYRTPATKDHRLFYGFAVSSEWLVAYCERNVHRINNYNAENLESTKIYLAIKLLRASSGLGNVTIQVAFCHALGSLELEHWRLRSVPVVTVCSSIRSSYERRPSQAQLDKLQSIIQTAPDWYVDVKPPDSY